MNSNRVWVGAGVLGMLSALSLQGCAKERGYGEEESESERAFGSIALGLTLPDGTQVTTVDYVIRKGTTVVRTDVLVVGSDGRASGTVTGLDAGTDYSVVLTAPRDGGAACSGQANFVVVANQTANVDVLLQCDDSIVDGNATFNGAFNICPKVTSTSITPVMVPVGSSAAITSSARDRDNDALSFAWSAASGTFSAPTAANTSYTCATPGTQTLTVSVTDGPARGCTRSATVSVTCVASGIDAGPGVDAGPSSDAGIDASPAPDAGTSSSASAYVVASPLTGTVVTPILTVGDSPNFNAQGTPYRLVGLPDGMGAYDNDATSFTMLVNHEIGGTGGIARAHGGTGSFVSKWTIRKSDLRVLHGEDLIRQVQLWNRTSSSYSLGTNVSFGRFCSADLAAPSAYYDAATSTGFQGRLFLNGEESGVEGRAFAHGMDGTSWEVPRLGKQSWENYVASPASGLKTVAIGMDDTSPSGQVYVYVGTKTNAGSAVDRAGLTNGTLYGVRVPGVAAEANAAPIPAGAFNLAPLGNVENQTGAQLEAAAVAAGVTTFLRPEDGAWDPSNPNDFYFVSTASYTENSRLWRLRFTNVTQPELGGQLEAVVVGNEGHRMFDNMTIDPRGHVLLQEDIGNQDALGKIWRYTIANDQLVEIATHDAARFSPMAPGFLTRDEEASGIIDATSLLGAGWFLISDQGHYGIPGELVEGGQLLALYDPGSL